MHTAMDMLTVMNMEVTLMEIVMEKRNVAAMNTRKEKNAIVMENLHMIITTNMEKLVLTIVDVTTTVTSTKHQEYYSNLFAC